MIKLDDFINEYSNAENYDAAESVYEKYVTYLPYLELVSIARSVANAVMFEGGNVHFNTVFVEPLAFQLFFRKRFAEIDVSDYSNKELYDIIKQKNYSLFYKIIQEDDYYELKDLIRTIIEDEKMNYASPLALATVFAPQISSFIRKYILDNDELIRMEVKGNENIKINEKQ